MQISSRPLFYRWRPSKGLAERPRQALGLTRPQFYQAAIWSHMTENSEAGPPTSFSPSHLANPSGKVGSRLTKSGMIAAMVSILATTYFLAAAVGAHVVMTQYNFFSDYISDYAVGPGGWIYGSAFLASALGCLALAVSIVLLIPSEALSRIGVVLLVLVGVTYVIDFVFPTDILPPGAPPTTRLGAVHLLDALVGWGLFTVGSVMISSRLRHDPYWKAYQPFLTTVALLSVLLLFVLVGVVISKAPFGGLAEKLFILDRNIWTLAFGILAFRAPDFGNRVFGVDRP